MLDVNIYHVGAVTKLFYQRLLDRTLQKPGIHSGIVTISSIASDYPMGFSIYHATKAWVSYMTEGLQLEVQRAVMPWSKMVDVMCLKPGVTVSNMPPKHIMHLATPTHIVVAGALNNLGQYSTTYGHWAHEVQGKALFGAFIPILWPLLFKYSDIPHKVDYKGKKD